MRWLLTAGFYLTNYWVAAHSPKPTQLIIRQPALFEKLTADLDASRLFRLYRPYLKLSQVRKNRHEPAIKDSVLTATTPADRLTLFKNRYTTLLIGATFTSNKVSFGGLKVGVTKEVFCRRLHLNPSYAVYIFTDGVEDFVQLTCTFADGKLKNAEFKYLVNPDTID